MVVKKIIFLGLKGEIYLFSIIIFVLHFRDYNFCVFLLQLILEYTRKLVLVARCPFSDLSTEGLVNKIQIITHGGSR